MERTRLKNIIILILLILNLSLLGTLAIPRLQTRNAHAQVAQELSELFASNGIHLDTSAIPAPDAPLPRTPVRTAEECRLLAAFFLGDEVTLQTGNNGNLTFRSDLGQALFRYNGTFDIRITEPAEDAETLIDLFCHKFGYRDMIPTLQENSGSVSATQYVAGYPAVDAEAVFRIENNALTAISGTYLPQSAPVSGEKSLSAATALTLFLNERRSSGAVVSSITQVFPCYRIQATSASPMALTPEWCIVTNIGPYYVNSITGDITLP